jgi:predicted peptidase
MLTLQLQRERSLQTSIGPLSYLLYQPPGFAAEPRPLLLFLHGIGERGSELQRVATHGIPALIERGKNFPFITVSPQCPADRTWGELTEGLLDLLDTVVSTLRADPTRIYLSGISMGAFGAWKLAAHAPGRFAALVPICGGADDSWAPTLAHLPTWVFHGALDPVVPVETSRRMVRALKAQNAPVMLTVYENLPHECWDHAYQDTGLFEWLLSRRNLPEAPARS